MNVYIFLYFFNKIMLKKTPQKNLNARPMSSYISKSYQTLNLLQSPYHK